MRIKAPPAVSSKYLQTCFCLFFPFLPFGLTRPQHLASGGNNKWILARAVRSFASAGLFSHERYIFLVLWLWLSRLIWGARSSASKWTCSHRLRDCTSIKLCWELWEPFFSPSCSAIRKLHQKPGSKVFRALRSLDRGEVDWERSGVATIWAAHFSSAWRNKAVCLHPRGFFITFLCSPSLSTIKFTPSRCSFKKTVPLLFL